MAQVYAVVHNGKGEFLIAFKNQKGYFFHDPENEGQGFILPAGKKLNGASNFALPGGGLATGPVNLDLVVLGARKEMLEETTIQLNRQIANDFYFADPGSEYYAAYFQAGADYRLIQATIHEKLAHAGSAAAQIANNTWTGTYPELIHDFDCPMDNELRDLYSWDLVEDWEAICQLLHNKATSWYYYILKNLRDTFFPIRITDALANTVGIGRGVAEIAGPEYIVDTLVFDPASLTGDGVYTLHTSTGSYPRLKFNPGTVSGDAGVFRPAGT
jgi:hypothetical protein